MAKKGSGLPFEILSPEDTEFINAIIYGDTGSGKTTLLGTANKFKGTAPILLIDVEGGTKSLRGKDVDVVRPLSWSEIQDIYNYLRHDNHKYRSVGVDSLSELQKKYSLGAILGDLKIQQESEYANLGETIVPTRQDWMKTGDQMRKFIRAFKDLSYIKTGGDPIHVFMTCLEKVDEKKDTIGPMFSGTLSMEAGAYVDVLARLSRVAQEKENADGETVIVNRRHLLVDAYENDQGIRYLAKNRGSGVRQIWSPSIKKIVQIVNGDEEAEKEEGSGD